MVGVTIQGADKGDTATMAETLVTATEQVETVLPEAAGVAEVVADKGYQPVVKVGIRGIDTAALTFYTGGHGDGHDARRRVAAIDVGLDGGSAAERGASVL